METTMPAERAGRAEGGTARPPKDSRPDATALAQGAAAREREYLREHIVLGYN